MIDVIVVNWNSGTLLKDCIDSIAYHDVGLVSKIIVVDNGSVDGSDASVEGLQNVTMIRIGANLGFGKACNLGVKHSQSDYILFLNPDAALYENTLSRAMVFMQDQVNSDVGICGVQLMAENGSVARHCARFPSVTSFFAAAIGLDRLLPYLGHFMAEWDHAQTREVDHVIGAFYLVRRSVFDLLLGFDERFFVYLEDLDFSFRARKAGWRTVYLASAQAFHAGNGTSNQIKARRLFYSLRSRILYAFKHFTVTGAVALALITLLVEPLSRTVLALARRSWPNLTETWGGYGMLWAWLPNWVLRGETR